MNYTREKWQVARQENMTGAAGQANSAHPWSSYSEDTLIISRGTSKFFSTIIILVIANKKISRCQKLMVFFYFFEKKKLKLYKRFPHKQTPTKPYHSHIGSVMNHRPNAQIEGLRAWANIWNFSLEFSATLGSWNYIVLSNLHLQ